MDDRIRLLHVEDDPEFADLTETLLERADERFDVEQAHSPAAAFERLGDRDVDCVVSDFDMPEQNGIELLKAVRERYPDLPFILFTGKGDEDVASKAISAGVTEYIQKDTGTGVYTVLANRIRNVVDANRTEKIRRTLHRAVEASGHSIYYTDEEGTIEYVNPAFEELTGYTSEEAIGRTPQILKSGVHEPEFYEEMWETILSGEVWRSEIVNEGKSGEQYVVDQTIAPVMNDAGEIERFVAINADITERKRRQAELTRIERRYRAIFNDPNLLVGLVDTDGTVLDINRTAMEYIESEIDAVVGEPFWTTPWFAHDESVRTNVRQGIQRTADGEYVSFEFDLVDGAGSPYTVRGSIRPVTDDAGEVVSLFMTALDITRRKRRERQHATAVEGLGKLYDVTTATGLSFEEKIDRLLEIGRDFLGLPYGFLTRIEIEEARDGQGTQTIVQAQGEHDLLQAGESCPLQNAYCRETIDSDGLLAVHNALVAGWEDDPAFETFGLGAYIGGKITRGEELYGTLCFAATDAKEQQFTELDRTFVRLMSRWVSYELERRITTERLRRQNARLEEFASVVSHDLRNPLNVATGHLELVSEECDSEHLDAVARSHDRMTALIDDLLALTRSGDEVTEPEAVELGEIATACWRNVDTAAATLRTPTERTVLADEGRLQQLFENLVRNAVEHGGADVTVTVGDLENGFYVADDGPGIPPKQREEVFEAGVTSDADGTGMGLSIVEQIAEAHGWTVLLTEGRDGGARFELTGVKSASEAGLT